MLNLRTGCESSALRTAGQFTSRKGTRYNRLGAPDGRPGRFGHVVSGKGKSSGSSWNRPRRPRRGVEVWLYSFFNFDATWGGGGG